MNLGARTVRLWTVGFLTACAIGPEPIHEGVDVCSRCGMLISDVRYAAESVVGTTARKYDSLDEMRADARAGARYFVTDFPTRQLVAADRATVLTSPRIDAPMEGHSIAFLDRPEALRYAAGHRLPGYTIAPFGEWIHAR